MSQGPKYPSTVAPEGYYDGLIDRVRSNLMPTLQPYLERATHVLELGSGTGIHAGVYAEAFDNIQSLQPTEADAFLVGQCRDNAGPVNERLTVKSSQPTTKLLHAQVLDVLEDPDWRNLAKHLPSRSKWDTVLINNCLHMIPFPQGATAIFRSLERLTTPDATFLASGPFKSDKGYFSRSDEEPANMAGS
ncbi:hypothetical protein OIV83_002182 [Microbotryomycetes sp. JL201]|nr:hypothetical protein OIV83_002182 [Microbotryomycetes sp. JL201]